MKHDLIEIARIKGPHGLRGKIRLIPYGDSFDQFRQYSHLIIGPYGNPIKMIGCNSKKGQYIVELDGITDISQVEKLKGEMVYVKREWLPELKEDEYYWSDLLGLQVMDTQGRLLGEIVRIFSTGSNDVYVVDQYKQHFIPATLDVIKEISMEKRIIVIDTSLLEGLID
ncbi:MAG: 16S rRNA processing protein RimM [Deltaproteobacteria bacterium]|nr:16S rRNA processing protein RimM [Deltaproteobacteria bacterium]